MSFLVSFKSGMKVVKTLSICYLLTIWSFICVYSWTSHLESKGYFIISWRGLYTTYRGDGAISTILAMKAIAWILLIVSLYYSAGAIKFLYGYREPIKYEKILNSFKRLKRSLKTYYVISWSIAVILVYNYFKLDSIVAFVFLTLPILIITLFFPLALIDVWIQKQRK